MLESKWRTATTCMATKIICRLLSVNEPTVLAPRYFTLFVRTTASADICLVGAANVGFT